MRKRHYTISGLALMVLLSAIISGINTEPKRVVSQNKTENIITPVVTEELKQKGYVAVTRVVDGDTIAVVINGKEEKVRLIGIDTPEVVDPRKPVQCFGKEASNKTKELLVDKPVRLESDETQGNRDKYKRLLRYVFLEDGTSFNEYMIKEGYAHEYTYQIPYTYQKQYKEAQRYAREHKKGLWADGVCGVTATTIKK